MALKKIASLRLWGLLTTHPDFNTLCLNLGELKSGINFALEPEWAYIRVGLYPGVPLYRILRYFIFHNLFCSFGSLVSSVFIYVTAFK